MSNKDYRYKWLSQQIGNLLGIYDTKYSDDLIEEHQEEIRQFFDDTIDKHEDLNKRVVFIWRTFYDKLVEETITVLEEGIPIIFCELNLHNYRRKFCGILVAPPTPPPEPVKQKKKGKGKGGKGKQEVEVVKVAAEETAIDDVGSRAPSSKNKFINFFFISVKYNFVVVVNVVIYSYFR